MPRLFDSVDVKQIPEWAEYAAGYVDGEWPTCADGSLKKHLPKAHLICIATSALHNADVLDVEPRDATNQQAAEWVRRQWARGIKRPKLYTSVSNWKPLANELARSGIKRRPWGKSYRRWSAHYTLKPHRCGRSCGMPGLTRAGATQWTNTSGGRNLDESRCVRSFFRG